LVQWVGYSSLDTGGKRDWMDGPDEARMGCRGSAHRIEYGTLPRKKGRKVYVPCHFQNVWRRGGEFGAPPLSTLHASPAE